VKDSLLSAIGLNTTETKQGGRNCTISVQVGMKVGTNLGGEVEINTGPRVIRV